MEDLDFSEWNHRLGRFVQSNKTGIFDVFLSLRLAKACARREEQEKMEREREKISGGMLANSSVDDEIFCQFLKRKRKRRQGKRSRGFDVDKPWTVLFLSISFTFHMVTYDYVCTRMKETKKNQICLGNLCRNENKSSSSDGASGDLFPLLVNS